jgi:hypothetical protein
VRRNVPPPGTLPPPAGTRLGRDIIRVLAFKLVALALLYALFFGPAQRVAVDAGGIASLLVAAPGEAGAKR